MEEKYQGAEKRQFERIDVNFVVIYEVNNPMVVRMMVKNKEVIAIAVNVSEGGLAFSTNYELPVSTLVRTKFIILNAKATASSERMKSIDVLGEVRHSFLSKKREYQVGVRFIDLLEGQRRFIADFTRLQKKA